MTTFAQMAKALSLHTGAAWGDEVSIPKGINQTERIRQLLRAAKRPVTANEIAYDLAEHFPNFGAHLVWLLLKYEIEKGRVIYQAQKYSWNHTYESAENQAIRDAVKLLKKHSYAVRRPA